MVVTRTLRSPLAGLLLSVASCGDDGPSALAPNQPTRSFRMGFSAIPARPSQDAVLAGLALWTQRADAAIMHVSVPYKAMLGGTSATTYVNTVDLPLAQYYRAKGLELVVMLDVTDGLNRAAEAPELVELGRSITEPAVQQLYRDYALAMAAIVEPRYLGLAAETNLIRMAAPAMLYDALRQMTNAAAAALEDANASAIPCVSVQVDAAWGRLAQTGEYQGVEQDFTDFPFLRALGLSSYPYFAYSDPDDIPPDYYSRLLNGRTLPVMVVEGGWTSAPVGGVASGPETQSRYLRRQAALLDAVQARAVFQLTFSDLDVEALGLPPGSILPLFASLGLVDAGLAPKPALAVWDSLFSLRRAP